MNKRISINELVDDYNEKIQRIKDLEVELDSYKKRTHSAEQMVAELKRRSELES